MYFRFQRTVSLILVITLTFGNAIPFGGGPCKADCPGPGSATCRCCASGIQDRPIAERNCCGQSQVADKCCQQSRSESPKSCCSNAHRGNTDARLNDNDSFARSSARDESTANVCRCSHQRPTPNAPAPERRDNVRIEFPAAYCHVDFLAITDISTLTPSFLDGVDYGLALMTHTRRQSLLCTWQI